MYTVIRAISKEELAKFVNAMLEDGWRCQGGVALAALAFQGQDPYDDRYEVYAQAMVKETPAANNAA